MTHSPAHGWDRRSPRGGSNHPHAAALGILTELGFLVEADPSGRTGTLIIRTGQAITAVGLAADLQRTLAKYTELPANGQQPSP